MHGSELVGVAGRTPENAQIFARKFGIQAFASVDDLLAQDKVDIVTISTPSGAHFEPAMAALKAGKHAVVEKPMEIRPERIDALMSAAAENGVTLAAILNRRFHGAMEQCKRAVDTGRLGRLTSASAYIKWYRTQAYYDKGGWRGTWALDGGGALMNQGVHIVDGLLYLAGPVKSVQANTACLAHENIEVEDIAVALLEFTSGARGVIEACTCAWSKTGHPARVQLAGTEGSLFLADETIEVWDFMEERPEDSEVRETYMQAATQGLGANDPNAIHSLQHQKNFEEVVTAIQEGREPATSALDAREAVELICAVYESAKNGGEKIYLSEPRVKLI